MQGQRLQQINDTKLNELLAHSGLIVLLITSTWDGHGIIMRTILEGISNQYTKVLFGVSDVEDSPRICKVFNVTNPPGLLLVKDGELIERAMGAIGGSAIVELIERNS
ncbi:thioredoxin family protein [Lewinella sp. IMCC34183]|uniref:thioredoxin family protein n=1 Tax=Lewinella sp. IMCC34183 TaxID=2248762 RepID=UPI000E280920|nr:thioredoxin family protein [Lewinella sp. IMCC34183]